MSSTELQQWLNLVHSSPKFVIKIDEKTGKGFVRSPQIVPANDGEYWVAGETRLKSGRKLASVFRVQTNSGGTLLGGYWRVGEEWLDQQDERSYAALASTRDKETPFDWSYAVPLTEDIYHS